MKTRIPRVLVPVGAGLLMFLIVMGAVWNWYSIETRFYGVITERECLTELVGMAETVRTRTGSYPPSLEELLAEAKRLVGDVNFVAEPLRGGSFVFEVVHGKPRASWLVPPEIRKTYSLPERLSEPADPDKRLPLVPFSVFAATNHFPRSAILAAATAVVTAGLWFLCVGRSGSRTRMDTAGYVVAALVGTAMSFAAAMVIMMLHVFPHH
jgi:hypothetical protein